MWSDCTFFFTAYTVTAAMEVAGLTTCKVAFLMTDRALSDKDKSMWRDVKLLIIDKISFMGNDHLKNLDIKLKEMRDKTKTFSGFSVIFAGDFC